MEIERSITTGEPHGQLDMFGLLPTILLVGLAESSVLHSSPTCFDCSHFYYLLMSLILENQLEY